MNKRFRGNDYSRRRVALIGECLIELNGAASGNLRLAYGGDSLNTALYLARLTRSTIDVKYVTVMGTDALTDAMMASWRAEGIDTSLVLRDSTRLPGNWAAVEPKLHGSRLQFFVTEDDNYYTNLALHRLQQRLAKLTPASDAQFSYFTRGGHCHSPITNEQLLERMAKFMTQHSPKH